MNSAELEIFDYLQGLGVENVSVDRNAEAHGEPAMRVTVKRAGYAEDDFWFRKSNKMSADAMGKIINQTLTRELAQ